MYKLLTFVFALLFAMVSHGQAPYGVYERGYIHLKDGVVIKGRYLYSNDLEKLRVVSGRNTWIFNTSEVELVTSQRPARQYAPDPEFNEGFIQPSRWFSLSEIGVLAGNPDNSQSAPLSVGTSLNYTFWNNLSAGAGVGVEFLKETYLPLSANLLYRLRDTRFSPYAVLQAGYQVPAENSRTLYYNIVPESVYSSVIWPGPMPINQSALKAKGGFLLNPAVGFISQSRTGYGFTFAVGYRFHRLRYSGDNEYNLDVDFNRLSVKFGLIIN
ncbi:MAG: hypothetical protein ACOZDD_12870 [Bacteroidota bacterium]